MQYIKQNYINNDFTKDIFHDETTKNQQFSPNQFFTPPACRNCPNHASNGGSGVCCCTLGGFIFY